MKIASHAWLDIPLGKISLPFKTMKNIKIADLVLSMNNSYEKDDLLQKNNIKYYSESKIRRHFCPSTMAGYPETKRFLFCLSLFLYYMLFSYSWPMHG